MKYKTGFQLSRLLNELNNNISNYNDSDIITTAIIMILTGTMIIKTK